MNTKILRKEIRAFLEISISRDAVDVETISIYEEDS